jgi:hypothetical protein
MTRSVTRFPFLAYAALVALPMAAAIGTAGAAPAPDSVPLTRLCWRAAAVSCENGSAL